MQRYRQQPIACLMVCLVGFRWHFQHFIISKGIEKWARHPISQKCVEDNQRQKQMRSAFCGINAFIILEIGRIWEMDIFNKEKIDELCKIIEKQKIELDKLKQEIDEKKQQKHKTGEWCEGCENCSSYYSYGICGNHIERFCLLDNECKDRKGTIKLSI